MSDVNHVQKPLISSMPKNSAHKENAGVLSSAFPILLEFLGNFSQAVPLFGPPILGAVTITLAIMQQVEVKYRKNTDSCHY